MLLWELNTATDLTGGKAQVIMWAMRSDCSYNETLLACLQLTSCCAAGFLTDHGLLHGMGIPGIQGSWIRLTDDFSTETMETRKQWADIFKVLKKKKCQPRILYLAQLSFRMKVTLKYSQINKNQRSSLLVDLPHKKILKSILQGEIKRQ